MTVMQFAFLINSLLASNTWLMSRESDSGQLPQHEDEQYFFNITTMTAVSTSLCSLQSARVSNLRSNVAKRR